MSQRKRLKKGLEPNLYEARGYYSYKHPISKKLHGMGKDKKKAIAAARQLNARFMEGADLVARVLNENRSTIADVIKKYTTDHIPTKKLKESTLKIQQYRINRISKDLGDKVIEDLGVKDIAEYLDNNFQRDAYVKHRNLLADVFKFAMTKGMYPNDGDNPVTVTYAKTDYQKERQRLTLEQFKQIRSISPAWLQNAMDFSLITLQGRTEVVSARFEHINIEDKLIKVVREKTASKTDRAFLEIEINSELDSVISRCRKSGIVSPYLIHRDHERRKRTENRDHWSKVLPEYLSKAFKKYRDETTLFNELDPKKRPTFHEIRSLGSWLYEKHGFATSDYVQPLMAHSDIKLTEYYQSDHEQKWVRVKAELPLTNILK